MLQRCEQQYFWYLEFHQQLLATSEGLCFVVLVYGLYNIRLDRTTNYNKQIIGYVESERGTVNLINSRTYKSVCLYFHVCTRAYVYNNL